MYFSASNCCWYNAADRGLVCGEIGQRIVLSRYMPVFLASVLLRLTFGAPSETDYPCQKGEILNYSGIPG